MNDARRAKKVRGLIALLAAVAGVCLWLALRDEEEPARPEEEPEPPAEVAAEAPPPPAPRPAPILPPPPPAHVEQYESDDGVPFMPPGPNDLRPDGPVHPHPITPQHERIFAENRLIGALNGAVDVKDAAGIRKLLAQYREEYPEDDHDVQEGFEAIADCLERPGEATRAAAHRFNEEHRGSIVRRYVNRICLEGQ